MIVPRYVPGEWVAVVSDGTVAMVPGDVDARTVERLWESARADDGLGAHLDVLVEGGLAAVPPFALVQLADGAVHAIVRGPMQVLVDADDGEHALDGATVTTWHEATVRSARSVRVQAASARVDGAASLPVLSAVVRAAAVDVELAREAAGRRRRAEAGGAVPSPRTARTTPAPVEPVLPEPVLPEPVLPEPVLPEPVVREPVLPEPVVREPADPVPPVDVPEPEPPAPVAPVTSPAPPAPSAPVGTSAPIAPGPGVPDPEPSAGTSSALEIPPVPGPPAPPPALDLPAPAPEPVRVPDDDGDHDGLTVQSTDVAALRRQLPEWAGDAVPGPFAVPAPQGPPPAKIHLSSGLVISLNRPVLLGRAPQVSRVQNAQIPRLVTVASPNQDISRTHAEVRQEGDHVLVTDLRSTNGVLLLREGHGPQRLHPGEPTVVEPGVVVDLGEGVTFVVEHGA